MSSSDTKGGARGGSRAGSRGKGSSPPVETSGVSIRMLNVGYGNLILASRVVAVVSPGSSPMKRLREEAISRNKLVDATQGRRTRSIIVTDSDHIVLSAINPETISARLAPDDEGGAGA